MTEQNITQPTPPTEQTWIEKEKEELGTHTEMVYEKLPALKFEENKITEFTVDLTEKFQTYETTNMKNEPVTKAIIPVLHNAEKKNLWLNKKNPLYREILDRGTGKTTIIMKVMQTGNKQNTKYIIVE